MAKTVTKVHKRLSPAGVKKLRATLQGVAMDSADSVRALAAIGIDISPFVIESYRDAYGRGMDAAINVPGLQLTGAGAASLQFLQTFLTGQVQVVTTARKADAIMGVTTAGSWEDEELIQEILELVGVAAPYTDFANIPLSSWGLDYERMGVVRFEEGCQVGTLEGLRSGRIGIDSMATKRQAAQVALDIARNRVAFYGYDAGGNAPVYGFLNAPNLPAYVTNASGVTWNVATRDQIISDLLTAINMLRVNSQEVVDPTTTPLMLVVASDKIDYLHTPGGTGAATGETAWDWLKANYPNVTVESATELNGANGGEDVFYLYAASIAEGGTDGGAVIEQIVPVRFRPLGVDTGIKVVTEDFTNATSGVLVKRPFGVVRVSGI